MQVTFGGHGYFFVNDQLKGQVYPPDTEHRRWYNYGGELVAHFYARGREGGTAKLLSVTPLDQVQMQTTVQAPLMTSRISVHLVDSTGVDRGPLGEVLVNPSPTPPQPRQ